MTNDYAMIPIYLDPKVQWLCDWHVPNNNFRYHYKTDFPITVIRNWWFFTTKKKVWLCTNVVPRMRRIPKSFARKVILQ